ncbi:hypothetical protein GCM10009020_27990 [Natronoarchaeum mannanilyticum]|uniref:Uncharacterized protein n=1 Tax=Natronoarchaeum mannanilyticum TaxID=926360 RepID=A0AAV3TBS7_9EURY
MGNTASDVKDDEKSSYERCSWYIIEIDGSHELPEEAEEEAMAAIEGERYETEGKLVLEEIMNADEQYLRYDDQYYDPVVEKEGDTSYLTAHKTTPETGPLTLENGIGDDIVVDLSLTYEGDDFLSETVEIEEGNDVKIASEKGYPYGSYEGTLETETLSENIGWTAASQKVKREPRYDIHEEYVQGPWVGDYDTRPCSWDEDGELKR